MNLIQKHSALGIGALLLSGMSATATHATQIPIAVTGYNSTAANISFTGGTLTIGGGPFSTIVGKAGPGTDGKVLVAFSPMSGGASSVSGGHFAVDYGSGSFTVTDPTRANPLLIGGSYTTSEFTGKVGGQKGFVEIDNITYNPLSSYLQYPTPATSPFSLINGSLSVEFGTFTPFSVTGNDVNNFTANDGITYFGEANGNPIPNGNPGPVPEPGTLAVLCMGSLAIVVLAKRKTVVSRLAS